MKAKRLEILQIILKPYTLDVLKAVASQRKRYNDLKKQVKNDRTLSLKLSTLQDYGLIRMVHVKLNGKYVNLYEITSEGKKFLERLKTL
jgi:DNA-binding HxlR family transcriptional regulator